MSTGFGSNPKRATKMKFQKGDLVIYKRPQLNGTVNETIWTVEFVISKEVHVGASGHLQCWDFEENWDFFDGLDRILDKL